MAGAVSKLLRSQQSMSSWDVIYHRHVLLLRPRESESRIDTFQISIASSRRRQFSKRPNNILKKAMSACSADSTTHDIRSASVARFKYRAISIDECCVFFFEKNEIFFEKIGARRRSGLTSDTRRPRCCSVACISPQSSCLHAMHLPTHQILIRYTTSDTAIDVPVGGKQYLTLREEYNPLSSECLARHLVYQGGPARLKSKRNIRN